MPKANMTLDEWRTFLADQAAADQFIVVLHAAAEFKPGILTSPEFLLGVVRNMARHSRELQGNATKSLFGGEQ
jgi:hypothetical protein